MLTRPDVRRRRIIGASAIVLGAVLLVLALLAITGILGAVDGAKDASDEAVSAGATSSASQESDDSESSGSQEPVPDVKAPLTVLNASDIAGLAGNARDAFEAEGWTVQEVGNLADAGGLEQSTVYYPDGDQDAQAAAENLASQFSELAAEPAPDGLGYSGVVVVLTGDWEPGQ